jgi:SAM-dependent methyltransferase
MQTDAWEREYRNPKFLTIALKPQEDILRFVKFLKKKKFDLSGKLLDLGCGTGRNSNFFAELGFSVCGFDISKTAIDVAKKTAIEKQLSSVNYGLKNIGVAFDFPDESFDLILDVTSSNSLNENERDVYIKEVYRLLKKDGYFFFKGLCLESDKNAKTLIKNFPGKEKDTYFLKDIGLFERVWTKKDLQDFYGNFFDFDFLDKKSSYQTMSSVKYKRNFWIAYLKKK